MRPASSRPWPASAAFATPAASVASLYTCCFSAASDCWHSEPMPSTFKWNPSISSEIASVRLLTAVFIASSREWTTTNCCICRARPWQ
jgi:hypothetical protein